MTLISKSRFRDEKYLYGFYDIKFDHIIDISKSKLEIKHLTKYKDTVFIFDPTKEELLLILDLGLEVVLLMPHIPGDFISLLENKQVQRVIIIDDLDELFLRKQNYSNYIRVTPFDVANVEYPQEFEEKSRSCLCYEELNNLTFKDVDALATLPEFDLITIYSGLKEIKTKEDFQKLKAINDSKVMLKSYPLFDPMKEISYALFTASFPKNKFPIVAAATALNFGLPLIFSDRYYKWIPSELQMPNDEIAKNLTSHGYRGELRIKQFEMFKKEFSNLPLLKDVIENDIRRNSEV